MSPRASDPTGEKAGFSPKDLLTEFVKIANQQEIGKGVKKTASAFVRNNQGIYDNLQITLSFGQGRATAVPWIAFTGYGQQVQKGIYPVYLYFIAHKLMILAYGISETNQAKDHWPDEKKLLTIEDYFIKRKLPPPKRYGSSFVYKAYDMTKPLSATAMRSDFLQLMSAYHGIYNKPKKNAKRIIARRDLAGESSEKYVVDALTPEQYIEYEPYDIETAIEELFIDESKLRMTLSLLTNKKNIVLQGPPGTGKTFLAKRLAYVKLGAKNPAKIQMIQFHQSYSYEDFIQGYRPNEKGGFEIKNGVFYDFCLKAQQDPNTDYFFIIDEINRGNLSKIFGESMMLIEQDKRGPAFAIRLTYSRNSEDTFYIPPNLFLIGTMNTADRSLAMVDYALRRRFGFVTIGPEFGPRFIRYLVAKGASEPFAKRICDNMTELNIYIQKDRNLGSGFAIGHSYFCGSALAYDEAWYHTVIEQEIRHLLSEYWFDNEDTVSRQVQNLTS